ncbi:exonuclease SbcCD subunit D [Corynebacterium choanae]|uniref:Nuclease SbcCD subunit D n=1 Tax=Corynebacterium choanae TaxID=1862358 RepID=A0A3G6J734_9CORY|nr:metallophosphoesterase [Corynebacterium choanae]AZA13632.1 Nuclease SbcCD subunit D [Corynebacterium choanae]
MATVKILHTSDWQLGMTRRFFAYHRDPSKVADNPQVRYTQAQLDAVRTLAAIAKEEQCDAVVVAGDVWDTNHLERNFLAKIKEALRQFSCPVFLLPGNHDPLKTTYPRQMLEELSNVQVIDSTTPYTLSDSVEIIGAPLYGNKPTKDPVWQAVKDLEPTDNIRVVVGHGTTTNFGDRSGDEIIDVQRLSAAIDEQRISYVALGDTHSATKLNPQGTIWYSGAPVVTDFLRLPDGGGETNSGKALVVTITTHSDQPTSVAVEEKTVSNWRMHYITKQINDGQDVAEFVDLLESYEDKHVTVVKYALQGVAPVAAHAQLASRLDELKDLFAVLYPSENRHRLAVAPTLEEINDLNLPGWARNALEELIHAVDDTHNAAPSIAERDDDEIAAASPQDQAGRATDAINLLFRLYSELNS